MPKSNIKNGIVRRVKPNGWIHEKQFKDDKMHGFCRWIYENGSYSTGYYKDGKPFGEWFECDANGQLKKHYRVVDG